MSNIVLKTTLQNGVVIKEDEKTGLYDITEMFKSVNEALGLNKQARKWLENQSTQELIEYRKLLKISDAETGDTDNQKVTNTVFKEIKGRKTSEGQKPSRMLGDPIIALDAASYMDVRVKNDVYEYYLDNKINERRKVKEQYKLLCSAIKKVDSDKKRIYPYLVHSINSVVFDRGVSGLWNEETTKKQLETAYNLMYKLTEYLNDGIVDTYTKLSQFFDREYEKQWEHKPIYQEVEVL